MKCHKCGKFAAALYQEQWLCSACLLRMLTDGIRGG